jgi:hypothetical protein
MLRLYELNKPRPFHWIPLNPTARSAEKVNLKLTERLVMSVKRLVSKLLPPQNPLLKETSLSPFVTSYMGCATNTNAFRVIKHV